MLASATKIIPLALLSMAAAAWAAVPADSADPAGMAGPAPTPPSDNSTGVALAAPTPLPALTVDPKADAVPVLAPPATGIDVPAPAASDPTGASGLLAAGSGPGEAPGAAIPNMPAYTVTASQVPVFRERDINTDKGMIAASFKRHPGLHIGNAFDLNANAAHELFLGDDWRSTMSDYSDMAHAMANGGDPAEGRMILSEVNDEDMEMRAEGNNNSGLPAFDRLQMGQLENDTRLLQAPEQPVDVSFVHVKW